MFAAKHHYGPAVTVTATDNACCITGRVVRARSLLRFRRFRSSSPGMPGGWHEHAVGNRNGTEPSLDELFWDSTIQLLMRRDGVQETDVRALLRGIRDARAASDGTKREHVHSVFADDAPDQEQNVVGSGSKGPPDTKRAPLRFI